MPGTAIEARADCPRVFKFISVPSSQGKCFELRGDRDNYRARRPFSSLLYYGQENVESLIRDSPREMHLIQNQPRHEQRSSNCVPGLQWKTERQSGNTANNLIVRSDDNLFTE
jgi:hypothetical protein